MTLRETKILGYRILNEPVERVAADVCDHLDDASNRTFVFLNPHSIVLAERDPALKQAIGDASNIFCDGVGLALAARVLNHETVHRVYGYEFFMNVSRELSRRNRGRVFFLGGQSGSIGELVLKYCAEFPGVAVDSYAPPFKKEFPDADVEYMARRIAEFRANVVWVGLGSPKQELLVPRLIQYGNIPCIAAIGAVFDFYAGRVPHAPVWVRRIGLQWLHRLVLEPRRLWRRIFVSVPLFLSHVIHELAHPSRR